MYMSQCNRDDFIMRPSHLNLKNLCIKNWKYLFKLGNTLTSKVRYRPTKLEANTETVAESCMSSPSSHVIMVSFA